MKKIIFLFLILCAGCIPFLRPTQNTVYASFGDCIASGSKTDPPSNSFSALTAAYLNKLYPNISLINCGVGGSTTQSYVTYLPTYFEQIKKMNHGPLARATLFLGMNDLTTIYEGCLSCTYSATFDQGVTATFAYKAEVQTMIDDILKFSPNCKIVLCTIPDPNNGGKGTRGPFNPPGLIKEFNKRIFELGDSNKLPVADVYTALMGHPDWFIQGDLHPNNDGHAVIASVVLAAFEGKTQPIPLKFVVPNPTTLTTAMGTPTPTKTPVSLPKK